MKIHFGILSISFLFYFIQEGIANPNPNPDVSSYYSSQPTEQLPGDLSYFKRPPPPDRNYLPPGNQCNPHTITSVVTSFYEITKTIPSVSTEYKTSTITEQTTITVPTTLTERETTTVITSACSVTATATATVTANVECSVQHTPVIPPTPPPPSARPLPCNCDSGYKYNRPEHGLSLSIPHHQNLQPVRQHHSIYSPAQPSGSGQYGKPYINPNFKGDDYDTNDHVPQSSYSHPVVLESSKGHSGDPTQWLAEYRRPLIR